ncbi:MAG: hypothetical protein M1385_02875 [Candidatus Marsarchaeota archaeon]|nr:hypothetical protein [Candidatus Marsarchaeota archaeon]
MTNKKKSEQGKTIDIHTYKLGELVRDSNKAVAANDLPTAILKLQRLSGKLYEAKRSVDINISKLLEKENITSQLRGWDFD